jgi:hypothetical protein
LWLAFWTGCGGAQGGGGSGDNDQDSEMTGDSSSGEGGKSAAEAVEPASHDIEVPPAP